METSPGYILVIGQPLKNLERYGDSPLSAEKPQATVINTRSPEQAVAQAEADHPYLVILSGDACQEWSPMVARQIRQSVQPESVIIVALTESSELSWTAPEPSNEIDGVFVKPLSADVLCALKASAIAKKRCLQPCY